jgi:predicted nuclease with RNAse H fold
MLMIGVDCATDARRVGLALAAYEGCRLSGRATALASRERPPAAVLTRWIENAAGPVLLALDAPLGWPEPMGRALVTHSAGGPIEVAPNVLFRRETDRFIRRTLRKTPLDVGSNLIARTACAALALLQELRDQLGLPIPLAWGTPVEVVSAIEVYPAATLIAHGFRSAGYKGLDQADERREILASLDRLLDVDGHRALLEGSADALDAVVCTLAGKDFVEGRAMPPEDSTLAQREGWIWAAPPQAP